MFSHDVKGAILLSQNTETAAMLVSQQPVVLVDAVVMKEFWKMGSVILFHGIVNTFLIIKSTFFTVKTINSIYNFIHAKDALGLS